MKIVTFILSNMPAGYALPKNHIIGFVEQEYPDITSDALLYTTGTDTTINRPEGQSPIMGNVQSVIFVLPDDKYEDLEAGAIYEIAQETSVVFNKLA